MKTTDEEAKPADADQAARLRSFCYKYLNMLDLLNTHFSTAEKHKKSTHWLKEEMGHGTYIGNWCTFYAKTFRKGTVGNKIMLDILEDNDNSGNYSRPFVSFAQGLLNKY